MNDRTDLFSIGQLARRTGLTVRTIRFWSDLGLLPPTARSAGGYRLYDAAAVARLELLQSLRELGIGLDDARRILDRQASVRDVARAHVRALEAEIRTLRLRRAVLRSITRRDSTTEEWRLMHDLARLSAQERQRIIDDFVTEVFAGLDGSPGAGLAQAMRTMPAELPDEPTDEEVDAWLELAELVADPDFRRRVREMAVAGSAGGDTPPPGPMLRIDSARAALAAGVAPDSDEARAVVDEMVDPALTPEERRKLADEIAAFTDRRVERYWQLIGVLNRREPFPPAVPATEWLIAALRAAR
ncbi:MerR family transcriptional regulator [Micromonospora globbae]|uniref:helix-turn-helix domain-containing protein n=1 Tax=Micromonospora globbae TaxID=1894969 RepID=UPI003866537E|nr:MerR family transcriptional regulator [Micromonospora globbae]